MDKPVTPENTTPVPDATSASWLKENLVNILIGLAMLGVVLRYLDPLSLVLAGAGLTFIIFIHELGHFAAAKLCNVRVEAFSIGFGPPIPFCSYKYGDTTYKLAMIPLGGFVKMLGEGDGANDEDADTDPRSFKNQSVGERMLIISAGVIMNIFLACILFVIVYMHGLEELPANVQRMEAGGTAWRHNIHSGSEITKIGSRENPWFDDIRPIVWATQQGEKIDFHIEYRGEKRELQVEPRLEEGAPFPLIGITPTETLTLLHGKLGTQPVQQNSPAAAAKLPDGSPAFQPGDTLVAMSDPDKTDRQVTAIQSDRKNPLPDVFTYYRRLMRLAEEPITFHVFRKGQTEGPPVVVTVAPTPRRETGLRMRMGSIVATRIGSPAANAGIQPKEGTNPGDRIVEVEIENADQTVTVFAAGAKGDTSDPNRIVKPLDPCRLPLELNRWADRTPGRKTVTLTVLREHAEDHSEKRVSVELEWDEVGRFDLNGLMNAQTPLAINGLGLAYYVQAVVDAVVPESPAAQAQLQANDTIEGVRIHAIDADGKVNEGRWETLKPHQWAFVDDLLQQIPPHQCDLRVNRGGQTREVSLTALPDSTLSVPERGLKLMPELRVQKASSILEALQMGAYRTLRMVQSTYINLYAMIFGRVSAVQTISGPITLARISYILAGESIWKLILMLALININLAVVNFLPIPVLDGGHMMFLIYEGLRGKPPPERVHILLTYLGLFLILCLMLFTIGLDIYRLLKVWLRW